MSPTLSQVTIYPVKSLKGISLESATVESRGLQYDRRWMVVDDDGKFITQREHPRMALVMPEVEDGRLKLAAPCMPAITMPIAPAPDSEVKSVRVWRSVCDAQVVDEAADAWLTDFLGRRCRLVVMPETTRRSVNPDYAAGEGIVSFADGYPLMLIGQASLQDLNERLEVPLPMNRFRPNLVTRGTEPFAEDLWKTIRIGEVVFQVVKPCDRCVMTTIDQDKGARQDDEPLRTLSSYRLRNQKVLFGMFLIPAQVGDISVGDPLEVVETAASL